MDIWESNRIRNLGCLYCIPDFVSLILVRRMSRATKIHHLCVCVFNYLSVYNDYKEENICRLIVIYAIFSTLAYLVNLLLASRFLNFSETTFTVLSSLSLLIYASACAVNWTWQVYYTYHLITVNNHWSIYLYGLMLINIIYDDLILNQWLYANIRRQNVGTTPAEKKE